MTRGWTQLPRYDRQLFGQMVAETLQILNWSYGRLAKGMGLLPEGTRGSLQKAVQDKARLSDDNRRKLVDVVCAEAKTRGIHLPCDIGACLLHGVLDHCQFLELAGFVVPSVAIVPAAQPFVPQLL